MDVYCHPFTSGGQELPIQEAKAAGLITLVTEYSCGTDSCYEHQGGIPLKWNEYREPQTQFIKATTCAKDIADKLEFVFNMNLSSKQSLIKNGQDWVEKEFSVQKIKSDLKKIFIELKNKKKDFQETKEEGKKQILFEDFLDKDDEGKRIAVVMPDSAGDVLMINSLLDNLKLTYPEYNIYIITRPQYYDVIEDNENIHKLIPYQDGIDNLHYLEGKSNHEGYFEIAFLPHVGTQRFFNYHHNGKDRIQFNIK